MQPWVRESIVELEFEHELRHRNAIKYFLVYVCDSANEIRLPVFQFHGILDSVGQF